ncbi:MAG TPA: TetR family transcriptional regulator [Chloroflexota bacterium]|nr:TetR family transcriptional regulator [Chloroflexota bacterium]
MPDYDEGKQPGLTRPRVIAAALEVIQQDGLDALTMRALAERLGVKAASLYWHVRDRGELVDLVAAALLEEVPLPGPGGGWRSDALALCGALARAVARRRDAARLLLEVPEALVQSPVHRALSRILTEGRLAEPVALATATMMLAAVLVEGRRPPDEATAGTGQPVSLAVDTGSRGVTLRAGAGMRGLIRAAHNPLGAAPAVIHGDRVSVRSLRGGRNGELELNPARAWRFRVQAPTWNTVLDLPGIDLRAIHIDSGAARVECILPPPRGVVPIDISSGVVGVRLRRPPGVPVVADVSAGALQLRLDGQAIPVTVADLHWESVPGAARRDHYQVKINSGAVRVTLEEDASINAVPGPLAPPAGRADVSAALNVVLDGGASSKR